MPDYHITREDFLLRRFPISDDPRYALFFKEVNGKKIPSSAAFKTKPNEDGLSVNIKSITSDTMQFVQDPTLFDYVEFSAAIPLDNNFECRHNPQTNNYGHALIVGDTNKLAKKITIALRAQ
jgi:hypothetical protein